MANDGKNIAVIGAGAALLGGLLAAFGKPRAKPRTGLNGPTPPKKKSCNCGR
jgi:hypothetical protein